MNALLTRRRNRVWSGGSIPRIDRLGSSSSSSSSNRLRSSMVRSALASSTLSSRVAQDREDVVIAEETPLARQQVVDRIRSAHLRQVGPRVLDVPGLQRIEEDLVGGVRHVDEARAPVSMGRTIVLPCPPTRSTSCSTRASRLGRTSGADDPSRWVSRQRQDDVAQRSTASHRPAIAVLVNDVGEINIDAALLQRRSADTIELTDGCVCCSISESLGTTLADMRAPTHATGSRGD